tara:strand:- start:240 stop:443 length:204 start_codon:yes stop_codon:yes gene_type:complete
MRTSEEVDRYRDNMEARMMRMETIMARVEAHLSKLNDRTFKLESWKSWMTGGMAGLFVIVTIMIGLL